MGNHVLSIGAEHELLLKLEEAGLNGRLAPLIINSPSNIMAKKIVAYVEAQAKSPDFQIAAEAVGWENFFDPSQWMNIFGKETIDITKIPKVPWSLDVLQRPEIGKKQMLFFIPATGFQGRPLDLVTWKNEILKNDKIPRFADLWFVNSKFALKQCEPGWHLISVCRAKDLTLELEAKYQVASAVQFVTANFLHALNGSGECLDEKDIVETCDSDCGYHVGVECTSKHTLRVCIGFPKAGSNYCIAISRRIPNN